MPRPRFVTLTTDIGWAYAAQIKAVLARRAPRAIVVDITHEIPPQSVRDAAFLLGRIAPQFPPGTVHLAIVDPGVGGARAALAVETGDGSFLVGPDNGALSLAARELGVVHSVRIVPAARAPSATFEGRDVFAPAAASLVTGTRLDRLGPAHPMHELAFPPPRRSRTGAVGEAVHIDVFGNVITNLPTDALPPGTESVALRLARNRRVRLPVRRTYELAEPGSLVLVGSSFGLLEVAERDGSAARRLRIARGARVELVWRAPAGGAGK